MAENNSDLERFAQTLSWTEADRRGVNVLQEQLNIAASSIGAQPIKLDMPDRFLTSPIGIHSDELSRLILADSANNHTRADMLDERAMSIQVVESNEKMVSLRVLSEISGIDMHFSQRPITQYAEDGYAGQSRIYWVREQVADNMIMIARAASKLGLMIRIEDGFRPEGVLKGLLRQRIISTLKDNPDMHFDQFKSEVAARTALYRQVAGHSFGAAVDFTLRDQNGNQLDLGNSYGEGGPLVCIDSPYITFEQWRTRVIFSSLCEMTNGFVYPEEDWHVSWGDPLGGATLDDELRGDFSAYYGPISNFNYDTGEIFAYENVKGSDQILSDDQIKAIMQQTLSKI